jgi:hypothetical protein
MSYNGGLDFGLLGDYDALPDIGLIAEGIDAALDELLAAARGKRARRPRSGKSSPASAAARLASPPAATGRPAPIIPTAHARPKRGPAADMRAKRERGSRPARKRNDS